jgi:hypothetical protein
MYLSLTPEDTDPWGGVDAWMEHAIKQAATLLRQEALRVIDSDDSDDALASASARTRAEVKRIQGGE